MRTWGAVALLGLLAACASKSQAPVADVQIQEARQYQAHARGDYTPPGTADDPWGPYITEAARRFDVPDRWIREVMRVESGGKLYRNGELVTSWVGAMGLMQVMPRTYDELKARYDLGDDAFDPHNNIIAGAAYIREMYDMYGTPGFLAAYNAGPRRLDDYLANTRPLPDETRHYVAKIGPYIEGVYPNVRSPAEDYAMNTLPTEIPPGLRYGGGTYADAAPRPRYAARHYAAAAARGRGERVEVAARGRHGAPAQAFANAAPRGWHLIPTAMAEPMPLRRGARGAFAIQVGAFGTDPHHAAAPARGVAKASAKTCTAHCAKH